MEEIVKVSPVGQGIVNLLTSPQAIEEFADQLTNVMHAEDIETLIDGFNEQEVLLKKAKEYSTLRAKYAALEAATYKKIVDKGWAKYLGASYSNKRRAAEWLSENPSEYTKCIDAILNNDETLVGYFRHTVASSYERQALRHVIEHNQDVVEEYRTHGRVNLGYSFDKGAKTPFQSEYALDSYLDNYCRLYDNDSWSEKNSAPSPRYAEREDGKDLFIAKDFHDKNVQKTLALIRSMEEMSKDSLRIRLRKNGAVGVGEGRYVNPDTHKDEIKEAIEIRRRNLAACIKRLEQLCRDAKCDFIHEFNCSIRAARLPIQVQVEALERCEQNV